MPTEKSPVERIKGRGALQYCWEILFSKCGRILPLRATFIEGEAEK